MRGMAGIAGLTAIVLAFVAVAMADDPPKQPFWSGRLAKKSKVEFLNASDTKVKADNTAEPEQPTDEQADPANDEQSDKVQDEPEWLRQLDPNDRTTLTGGWQLQNVSGGTDLFTTAGDRDGYFSPNTYQGEEFQQWHNVSTRDETPSWNGFATMFPPELWSHGDISPNTYFGSEAQLWGGMTAGEIEPNLLSGGWTWR